MSLKTALLSICVASLALGVDGQNIDYAYIGLAFGCIVWFGLIAVSGPRRGHFSDDLQITSFLMALYILSSSLWIFVQKLDYLSLMSTAPLILLPLSFIFFHAIRLSNSEWEEVDADKVCVFAALIFCSVLIFNHTADYLSAIVTPARFTWFEFRAVNPLPILASTLIVWRHGIRAIWRIDFVFLAVFIYATKYVNWAGLLGISFILRGLFRAMPNVWWSAALMGVILVINTFVAIYWRDIAGFAPGEFERIYEIQFAYHQLFENPVFGEGFGGSFANASLEDKYSMHNLLAYVVAFGGLVGVVIFAYAMTRYSRANPGKSEYLVVVYLILTATAASFKLPSVQLYLGFAIAVAAASRQQGVRVAVCIERDHPAGAADHAR